MIYTIYTYLFDYLISQHSCVVEFSPATRETGVRFPAGEANFYVINAYSHKIGFLFVTCTELLALWPSGLRRLSRKQEIVGSNPTSAFVWVESHVK